MTIQKTTAALFALLMFLGIGAASAETKCNTSYETNASSQHIGEWNEDWFLDN